MTCSKHTVSLSLVLALSIYAGAQQLQHPVAITGQPGMRPGPDMRAWTDPALNHNKLIVERSSEGGYKLVGPYKVVGTCFLFGEHHKGDMYAPEAKALNVFVSYNTYNQELEFYSTANPDKPLVKEPGDLDSFNIQSNVPLGIISNLKFVYGSHLGSKDKAYFLEMFAGERFSLYKKYKSDLDYVSSNLGQSELRQFDLQYEYYYHDNQKKSLKKLKANAPALIKEFKSEKDLSAVIGNEDFANNPEDGLRKAFRSLNNK